MVALKGPKGVRHEDFVGRLGSRPLSNQEKECRP